MKQMIKRAALVAAAALMTPGVAYALPEVSNVVMTQSAGSRIVEITYDLNIEAAIVTLGIETNGIALPDSAVTRLSGDVCRLVEAGANKRILWNTGADWPENLAQVAKPMVTAWATNAPPQVMVIDLIGGSSADSYPLAYYPSLDALPYGGLSNTIYKSTSLVMRKIPAGGFTMGNGPLAMAVKLSQDFYIGVFEVTQGQWYRVMGSKPSYFTDVPSAALRPVETISYDNIRGNSTQGGGGWPTNNSVYANSFMGRIRARTGNVEGFDLPTEAQWEYACRAGTTTFYNDGLGTPASTTSNAQIDVLARYKFNGGEVFNGTAWVIPAADCDVENGTAIVGSYLPNAWGLYDMHGNVFELCLDWYKDDSPTQGGEDPRGVTSGTKRVRRGGGSHFVNGSHCNSVFRSSSSPSGRDFQYGVTGFRLVRTLP